MSFTSFSLQDTLLRAVKLNSNLQQTGTPPTPKTHKWSYASAFLYSLTLITTIGESHFVSSRSANTFLIMQLCPEERVLPGPSKLYGWLLIKRRRRRLLGSAFAPQNSCKRGLHSELGPSTFSDRER